METPLAGKRPRSPGRKPSRAAARTPEQKAAAAAKKTERQRIVTDNHDAAERAEAARRDEGQRALQQAERDAHDRAEAERAAQRRADEQAALVLHRHAIKGIDDRERHALQDFDTQRRTLAGRAVEFIKGRQHFEAQRKAIMDRPRPTA